MNLVFRDSLDGPETVSITGLAYCKPDGAYGLEKGVNRGDGDDVFRPASKTL